MMMVSSSYACGLVLLLLASVCWISASILVQYLYQYRHHHHDYVGSTATAAADGVDDDQLLFDSPFLLTYVGTSLFSLLLPMEWANANVFRKKDDDRHQYSSKRKHEAEQQDTIYTVLNNKNHWTKYKVAAAKIAPVYFLANYCFNASLRYTTSITSTTVLASCTGPLFAFLIALWTREESFSWYKVLGVFLGVVGSIVLALHDAATHEDGVDGNNTPTTTRTTALDPYNNIISNATHPDLQQQQQHQQTTSATIWGDALALLSAVGYAWYTVMLRMVSSSSSSHPPRQQEQRESLLNSSVSTTNITTTTMNMQLLMGLAGLWNMILWSPILISQWWPWWSMTTPTNPPFDSSNQNTWFFVLGCLVLKGLLDNVMGDFLYARAVVLTSATVASVGGGLQVPLAMLCDVIVLGRPNVVDAFSVGASAIVLLGFVLVNLGQPSDEEAANKNDREENHIPLRKIGHRQQQQVHDLEQQADGNDLLVQQSFRRRSQALSLSRNV